MRSRCGFSGHFILDGTFSNYDKAVENIPRSLDKPRVVFIFFLFQKPELAWKFTLEREKREGRNIPKAAFIEQFLASRETANKIRKDYGEEVVLFLVKKDFEKNVEDLFEIKPGGRTIDDYREQAILKTNWRS